MKTLLAGLATLAISSSAAQAATCRIFVSLPGFVQEYDYEVGDSDVPACQTQVNPIWAMYCGWIGTTTDWLTTPWIVAWVDNGDYLASLYNRSLWGADNYFYCQDGNPSDPNW